MGHVWAPRLEFGRGFLWNPELQILLYIGEKKCPNVKAEVKNKFIVNIDKFENVI